MKWMVTLFLVSLSFSLSLSVIIVQIKRLVISIFRLIFIFSSLILYIYFFMHYGYTFFIFISHFIYSNTLHTYVNSKYKIKWSCWKCNNLIHCAGLIKHAFLTKCLKQDNSLSIRCSIQGYFRLDLWHQSPWKNQFLSGRT